MSPHQPPVTAYRTLDEPSLAPRYGVQPCIYGLGARIPRPTPPKPQPQPQPRSQPLPLPLPLPLPETSLRARGLASRATRANSVRLVVTKVSLVPTFDTAIFALMTPHVPTRVHPSSIEVFNDDD
jgi:hypothetical protein